MQEIMDPSAWLQAGGLIGLVVFALFAALLMFIRAQTNIYEMHRNDLKALLEIHKSERDQWISVIDIRQKETNQAIRAMASAINELNARARRYTNGHEHDEHGY